MCTILWKVNNAHCSRNFFIGLGIYIVTDLFAEINTLSVGTENLSCATVFFYELSSLPCTIKRSLSERLNGSKTFVLIVGANTKSLTKGACRYCSSYNWGTCSRYYNVDNRSFIEYECEKAIKDNLKIAVIYNYANVDKSKCPDCIKYYGTHIPAYYYANDGKCYWNIARIKEAINW